MNREKITTRPLKELHSLLLRGDLTAGNLAEAVILAAPEAFAANAYIHWEADELLASACQMDSNGVLPHSLCGLPVSVKDIFDVAGKPTTCASRFYAAARSVPERDAGYVARWRRAGGLLAGKTNLNEFAFGITGENISYGDCTIPGFPQSLTGGSSSGAAASVVAGAACAALGTDTGGSLRVPAALCGLVSMRQSLGFGEKDGLFPLAHSFDTVGWIQRHLDDVSWLARKIHPDRSAVSAPDVPRFGLLMGKWLEDVEPEIVQAHSDLAERLRDSGATVEWLDTPGFAEAVDLFVPIQAFDAFTAHAPFWSDHQSDYDPAVRARIELGSRIDSSRYQELQSLRTEWVANVMTPLWQTADFLVAPATSMTRLAAGADHSKTRPRLLKLTTPASLAGLPVLTTQHSTRSAVGLGHQWMAPQGFDAELWGLADWLSLRGTVD